MFTQIELPIIILIAGCVVPIAATENGGWLITFRVRHNRLKIVFAGMVDDEVGTLYTYLYALLYDPTSWV